MNIRPIAAAVAAALLLGACATARAAEPVDFDGTIDASAALGSARQAVKDAPAVQVAATTIGNIWSRTDSKEATLEPGQKESAYVDMDSAIYKSVCETPSPYTGPICHDEVMFRDVLRFKLVLTAPIPAEWGRQSFRLRLDSMRRPALSIEALDKKRAYAYKLPEIYEDVLLVTPSLTSAAAAATTAALTVCTLKDIVKDQCVYGCPDGKTITKPVAEPPALACPQILIPF